MTAVRTSHNKTHRRSGGSRRSDTVGSPLIELWLDQVHVSQDPVARKDHGNQKNLRADLDSVNRVGHYGRRREYRDRLIQEIKVVSRERFPVPGGVGRRCRELVAPLAQRQKEREHEGRQQEPVGYDRPRRQAPGLYPEHETYGYDEAVYKRESLEE